MNAVIGERAEEARVHLLEMELDGIIVGAGDAVEVRKRRRGEALLGKDVLKGEFDVVAGERLAVVEADVFGEREGVGQAVVADRVAGGQIENDLFVVVGFEQTAEHILRDDVHRAVGLAVRVQRDGLGRLADDDGAAGLDAVGRGCGVVGFGLVCRGLAGTARKQGQHHDQGQNYCKNSLHILSSLFHYSPVT